MSMTDAGYLRSLWDRVQAGTATVQERIDVAALAGRLMDRGSLPGLWRLAADPEDTVKYFALQSLVLDLGVKTGEAAQLCWNYLENASDEDLRAMAAACLGSIFFNSRRQKVFARLEERLHDRFLPRLVKAAIYSALFKVAGAPPIEWPELVRQGSLLDDKSIDWDAIARLRHSLQTVAKE